MGPSAPNAYRTPVSQSDCDAKNTPTALHLDNLAQTQLQVPGGRFFFELTGVRMPETDTRHGTIPVCFRAGCSVLQITSELNQDLSKNHARPSRRLPHHPKKLSLGLDLTPSACV